MTHYHLQIGMITLYIITIPMDKEGGQRTQDLTQMICMSILAMKMKKRS